MICGKVSLHRGVVSLQCGIAGLHRGIVGLQCGVVPACRQAGTGKKACKSFVSRELGNNDTKKGERWDLGREIGHGQKIWFFFFLEASYRNFWC